MATCRMEFDDHVCMFPCGKQPGETCHVPVQPHVIGGWEWNGDRDKPTLNPSVHCLEEGCNLHIWIRDGEVVHA